MKFLFTCVHPDDLEFNCGNLIYYLSQKGQDVHIFCYTRGEFGIFVPEWKGPRLGKIRSNELIKAAAINGVPKEKVHFGNIIDGFVRFNRENIEYSLEIINKLQPDIIFAPEPFFTYYWHTDHLANGRLMYHLFMKEQRRVVHPIRALYFYSSLNSNFPWPFNNSKHANDALYQHQSQWWLLKWNLLYYSLDKINTFKKRIGPWKLIEKFRRVYRFQSVKQPNAIIRLVVRISSNIHVIDPPESHFVLPDMTTSFGQQVNALRKKYNFKD